MKEEPRQDGSPTQAGWYEQSLAKDVFLGRKNQRKTFARFRS
jgi:hypothetical protein